MRRAVLIVMSASVLIALRATAASIVASVDSSQVANGESFEVTVEISGREVERVSVPQLDGATIADRPNYSGTQVKVINGAVTSAQTLGYSVMPDRLGPLVIPPFEALVDGETIKSNEIRVTVSKSQSDGLLFPVIKTDKTVAYQGEAIALTMELWIVENARVRINPTGFPEVTGFYALPSSVEDILNHKTSRGDTRDGKQYQVVTFTQMLFPASSGTLRIGPWSLDCDIGYAGRARNHSMKTQPFTIEVKKLPPPPDGFSGSVGKYQVAAALSIRTADVGVPLNLTVGVVGDGNPDAIGKPRLPAIDGMFVDEPRRSELAAQPGGANGKNYVYKLTPQRPGAVTVPVIEYIYFDPEQKSYQTARTEPIALTVRGTAKQEVQVVVGAGGTDNPASSLGTDIVESGANTGTISPRRDLTVPTGIAIAAPSMTYAAYALYLRRRRRFASDRAYARAYGALKAGVDRLAEADPPGANAADALYRAVTMYVADQFNLPSTGMTSAEAQMFFDRHATPADIADTFIKILRACERARYAATALSDDEVRALVHGARTGMERLDEVLKRRLSG